MYQEIPANADASSGYISYELMGPVKSATIAKPLTPNPKASSMALIGTFIMTWQQVILCVSFVAGGVVLGLNNKETLAATILGAAAGYLAQPFLTNGKNREGGEK
jgi:hypothetical protein